MKSLPALKQEEKIGDGHLYVEVTESRGYYQETHDSEGRSIGHGQFNLSLSAIALQGAVYIPLSLASGKKPTGFVYEIEGTGEGNISTATLSCSGEDVTQVTLGTLRYAKIPQGKTAVFEMVVHIEGSWGNSYRILINRIHYKLSPSDARYKKLNTSISTNELMFR